MNSKCFDEIPFDTYVFDPLESDIIFASCCFSLLAAPLFLCALFYHVYSYCMCMNVCTIAFGIIKWNVKEGKKDGKKSEICATVNNTLNDNSKWKTTMPIQVNNLRSPFVALIPIFLLHKQKNALNMHTHTHVNRRFAYTHIFTKCMQLKLLLHHFT